MSSIHIIFSHFIEKELFRFDILRLISKNICKKNIWKFFSAEYPARYILEHISGIFNHYGEQKDLVSCFVLFYGLSTLFGSFKTELRYLIKVSNNSV